MPITIRKSLARLRIAALHVTCVCVLPICVPTGSQADDAPQPSAGAVREPLDKMLPSLHLLEPIWRSNVIHRESVLCVRDAEGQPALGRLFFPAEKILVVQRADGGQVFAAGRDFELRPGGRELALPTDSRIPQLAVADLFPPAGAARSIAQKTGYPARSVLFENGHWFHDQQVEVTYVRRPEKWLAVVPVLAEKQLPHTLARLKSGKSLTLAVSGDSISQGYNASGFSQAPPWMPPYPDLVAEQLRQTYQSQVTLHNRAISGWGVAQGLNDLDALLATKPDLIVIAYGMNNVGSRNPEGFRASIATMLERIHSHNAETEVILVAPMLGNADWVHTPREMFRPYRDALASFVGRGVALADLTELWQHMLRHKRDVDLTGNGVNHPSDFGHRLYAQVILALLAEPSPVAPLK